MADVNLRRILYFLYCFPLLLILWLLMPSKLLSNARFSTWCYDHMWRCSPGWLRRINNFINNVNIPSLLPVLIYRAFSTQIDLIYFITVKEVGAKLKLSLTFLMQLWKRTRPSVVHCNTNVVTNAKIMLEILSIIRLKISLMERF